MNPFFIIILLLFNSCKTQPINSYSEIQNETFVANGITEVSIRENGELCINVSQKDALKFKDRGWVYYSDFGAKGDGKTDAIDAIAAAHTYANTNNLLVKADDGFTYYIGKKDRTAVIETDTDFGTSTFIIDDTSVQNHNAPIFRVRSRMKPFKLKSIASLKMNQEKIEVSLPGTCLIKVTNSNVKHFRRLGVNQNNGFSQIEIFDKNTRCIL